MAYDFSDAYNHPGSPLFEDGPWKRPVLRFHGDDGGVLWSGGGASEDGARPFLDVRSFADGTRNALPHAGRREPRANRRVSPMNNPSTKPRPTRNNNPPLSAALGALRGHGVN